MKREEALEHARQLLQNGSLDSQAESDRERLADFLLEHDLSATVRRLQNTLADRDATVDRLDRGNAAHRVDIRRLQEELARSHDSNRTAERERREHRDHVERLDVTIANLRHLVDAFKTSSLLVDRGGDPSGITPEDVEREIQSLRNEVERFKNALREEALRLGAVRAAVHKGPHRTGDTVTDVEAILADVQTLRAKANEAKNEIEESLVCAVDCGCDGTNAGCRAAAALDEGLAATERYAR